MNVLLCTASTSADRSVEAVRRAIEARGGRALRLETDRFPSALPLALAEEGGLIRTADGDIAPGAVDATWIRHLEAGAALPEEMDPAQRQACRLASEEALLGLLECLPGFQLDPPARLRAAPSKPRQLQLARRLGLVVPRTLVSNDAAAVRDFARALGGAGIVMKMVDSGVVGALGVGRDEPLYTRALAPEDLADLDGLELCPMIFQERIEKALELRVTAVGRRCFVAAVDPRGSDLGADDWRRDPALVRAFLPYAGLPGAVEEKLLGLLDAHGLNFSTFDLILTPEGRLVFLEMNTLSYFDFIEEGTGLPISAAVADLLLGRAPRRAGPTGAR